MACAAEQADLAGRGRPLSRDAIVLAGVQIADNSGLPAVSMRSLARALGVEAMSLYHHVANKEDLLDGMVDLVFGEFGEPRTGADWVAEMRERSRSARRVLSRHPWAVRLMDSRRHAGRHTLQHHDAVVACLRASGFSLALIGHARAVLDAHLYGSVLQESNLPFNDRDSLAGLVDPFVARLPEGDLPHLRAYLLEHMLQPGYAFADEFEVGLDLILAGLAVQLERERASASS